jgi:hypothetical protein
MSEQTKNVFVSDVQEDDEGVSLVCGPTARRAVTLRTRWPNMRMQL